MNLLASFMTRAVRTVGRFGRDTGGATAIEYGLVVALISVAITASVFATGQGVRVTLYERLANALANM